MKKIDYDASFFEYQKKKNISSAEIIVPIVLDIMKFNKYSTSVIDLGCGSGNWLSVFKNKGCKVLGVDGWCNVEQLMIDEDEFLSYDFRKPFLLEQKFDLAVSLECAEHIPSEKADIFIDSLVRLSDIILFSAAIPHQRGRGHVNEQYQQYWIDKFDLREYECYDVIRNKIWNNENVRAFYAQNMFIFVSRKSEFYKTYKQQILESKTTSIANIIHPGIWEDTNGYFLMKLMDKMHDNPIISWLYYKFIKRYIKFN